MIRTLGMAKGTSLMPIESVIRDAVLMPFHHKEHYVLCLFYHMKIRKRFQVYDSKHINNVYEGPSNATIIVGYELPNDN
jgi:hypothetical protein